MAEKMGTLTDNKDGKIPSDKSQSAVNDIETEDGRTPGTETSTTSTAGKNSYNITVKGSENSTVTENKTIGVNITVNNNEKQQEGLTCDVTEGAKPKLKISVPAEDGGTVIHVDCTNGKVRHWSYCRNVDIKETFGSRWTFGNIFDGFMAAIINGQRDDDFFDLLGNWMESYGCKLYKVYKKCLVIEFLHETEEGRDKMIKEKETVRQMFQTFMESIKPNVPPCTLEVSTEKETPPLSDKLDTASKPNEHDLSLPSTSESEHARTQEMMPQRFKEKTLFQLASSDEESEDPLVERMTHSEMMLVESGKMSTHEFGMMLFERERMLAECGMMSTHEVQRMLAERRKMSTHEFGMMLVERERMLAECGMMSTHEFHRMLAERGMMSTHEFDRMLAERGMMSTHEFERMLAERGKMSTHEFGMMSTHEFERMLAERERMLAERGMMSPHEFGMADAELRIQPVSQVHLDECGRCSEVLQNCGDELSTVKNLFFIHINSYLTLIKETVSGPTHLQFIKILSAFRNSHGGLLIIHEENAFFSRVNTLQKFLNQIFGSILTHDLDTCEVFKLKQIRNYEDVFRVDVEPSEMFITCDLKTKFTSFSSDKFENGSNEKIRHLLFSSRTTESTEAVLQGISSKKQNVEPLRLHYNRRAVHVLTAPSPRQERKLNQLEDSIMTKLSIPEHITSLSKKKSGGSIFVVTTGIKFDDTPLVQQERFKNDLMKGLKEHLLYQKNKHSKVLLEDIGVFKVALSKDTDSGDCIIEIAVGHVNGCVFYDPLGPESYKIEEERIVRLPFETWVEEAFE